MQNPDDYVVVNEPTNYGYSVYVPDLPGCVSVGENREEAHEMIAEAMILHRIASGARGSRPTIMYAGRPDDGTCRLMHRAQPT